MTFCNMEDHWRTLYY